MQSVEYCQSEGEDGCRNLASEGELVWAAWLATFYGSAILRYQLLAFSVYIINKFCPRDDCWLLGQIFVYRGNYENCVWYGKSCDGFQNFRNSDSGSYAANRF